MGSEIVCPFCGVVLPFVDLWEVVTFLGTEDCKVYRCSCGAVAFPSDGPPGQGTWGWSEEQIAASEMLSEIVQGQWDRKVQEVRNTDPPLLMLWARRGASGYESPGRERVGPEAAA